MVDCPSLAKNWPLGVTRNCLLIGPNTRLTGWPHMRAALHQGLDAFAKILHAVNPIIEYQHYASGPRYRAGLVQHACYAFVGPHQRTKIKIDGALRQRRQRLFRSGFR
jgi:hypothetical protein